MKRGSKYLPMIQNVFRAEGLPLDLAYVPLVESAFKPNALSRAKAKGVWQFMTGTALENGLRRDWYIDERSDPEKATRRGGEVSAHAQQDVRRRLAPGAGVVQRRPGPRAAGAEDARASTISGSWPSKPKLLPRETREYVPMILAAIVIARNPAQYRLRLRAGSADRVTKRSRCPGRSTCVASPSGPDTTIDEIQALNPELRRWTTPVKDAQYELKVPGGHRRRSYRARLADAPSGRSRLARSGTR